MLDQNMDRILNAIFVVTIVAVFFGGIVLITPEMFQSVSGPTSGYDILYELNGGTSTLPKRHLGIHGAHEVPIETPTAKDEYFARWIAVDRGLVRDKGVSSLSAKYGESSKEYKAALDNDSLFMKAGIDVVRSDLAKYQAGQSGYGYIAKLKTYLPTDTFEPEGHTIMIADWSEGEHSISYDLNQGVGSFDNQRVKYKTPYTLYGHVPTRDGFVFGGWLNSISREIHQAGDTVSLSSDVQFKAEWSRDSYTVQYDLAGGTGTYTDGNVKYNDVYDISDRIPVKTGYIFDGWMDQDGVEYQRSDKITIKKSVVLTAQWQSNEFMITHNLNGGSADIADMPVLFGESHTITSIIPVRKGFTFTGWTADDGTKYASGDTIKITNPENYTLTATWSRDEYTVKYDTNGGVGSYGDAIVGFEGDYLIDALIPKYKGHVFAGWRSSVSGVVVKPNSKIVITEDTVLTAVWGTDYAKVSYDLKGGSGRVESVDVATGEPYTLTTQIPAKTGYIFKGWLSALDNMVYKSGATLDVVVDTVFTAQWEAETYTVSYDLNGGTGSYENESADYGFEYQVQSKAPTREGYTFKGWTRSDNGLNIKPGATFKPLKDVKLVANWDILVYNVSYDLGGGIGSIDGSTINHGETIQVSRTKPTRKGFTFDGWVRLDTDQSVEAGSSIQVTGDITIMAQWVRNQFNITFNANGGVGEPVSLVKEYDIDLNLPTDIPSRKYYYFDGWTLERDGLGRGFDPGGIYSANDSVTLYARWLRINNTVMYQYDDGVTPPLVVDVLAGSDYYISKGNHPSREGMIFMGWHDEVLGVRYHPGSKVDVTVSVELVAKWRPESSQLYNIPLIEPIELVRDIGI